MQGKEPMYSKHIPADNYGVPSGAEEDTCVYNGRDGHVCKTNGFMGALWS